MKHGQGTMVLLVTAVILGAGLTACGFLGLGGVSWKEEALLHDGRKIIVKRSVNRGGRHEIGQKSPYKEQSLSFTMPDTGQKVTWEDKFSEDLGMANFLPMLLDVRNGVAYLVVSPMGCLSYNKWGRPNPPYIIFKHDGKEWLRIPLSELPAEIKTPNLIISAPDTEMKLAGKRFMPAEGVRKANRDLKQPEYQTILREPVKPKTEGSNVNCEEMIHYKCGWISPHGTFGRDFMDKTCK